MGGARRLRRKISGGRRLGSLILSLLTVAGLVGLGAITLPAVTAQAAPSLSCGSIYSIQGTGQRNLWAVNPDDGGMSTVGSFDISGSSQNLNGLGLANDGSVAYGVLPANVGQGRAIYAHVRSTETTTRLGDGASGTPCCRPRQLRMSASCLVRTFRGCGEGPAGVSGGALVVRVSWWSSGCRYSVVTSVTAARAEDSSTMALPAA